ncbi:MAG: squalene synthase HpnC [Planctomycetaceae bacterium]
MSFLQEVDRWRNATEAPSLAEAEAYCAQLATSHYENFPVVSWVLPKRLHQHFYNVYAYCRWADDLGDEVGSSERALELLGWWQGELDACYAGQVKHPVFVALQKTIQQFEIPRQPFADLISAFVQDQTVHEYDTFDQLLDYCCRSANPVGRLVLRLAECDTPQAVEWSDSICTGLQLANFWQDVARDAAIGRVYLPREDRETFHYSESQRELRKSTPEFVSLMRFEVDRARGFLKAGRPLVGQVPLWLEVEIDLFIQGGLQILKEIETIRYSVWEVRPTVSKWALAQMFMGSLLRWTKRRLCGS